MARRTKWIAGGALVAGVLATGVGVASAAGSPQDDDRPITGDALGKASAAALAYTREGKVTETEVGDEEGYYEVEVTLEDGRQVDVHLDENFKVLGSESDDPGDRE
ncbi:MAG: PepSY domain-containing protein [Micromonosporaceae bacterium]